MKLFMDGVYGIIMLLGGSLTAVLIANLVLQSHYTKRGK